MDYAAVYQELMDKVTEFGEIDHDTVCGIDN